MRGLPPAIALCALLGACSLPLASTDPDALDALADCPPSVTNCVEMKANLKWPAELLPNVSNDGNVIAVPRIGEHPAVLTVAEKARSGDFGYVIVRVIGRLNDGEPRQYRLKLDYPNDMLGCNHFEVAALGAQREGGGTIITRQGTLDIISAEFIIGDWYKLAAIDQAKGTIAYSFAPNWEEYSGDRALVVTTAGRLFWRVGDKCMNLDTADRFRVVRDAECTAAALSPASAEEIRQVTDAKIFSDAETVERLSYDLWHAEGTSTLVYLTGFACT